MELTEHILLDDLYLLLQDLTTIEGIISRISTRGRFLHLRLPLLWLVDDVPPEELRKVFGSILAGILGDEASMQIRDILQIPIGESIILLVLGKS